MYKEEYKILADLIKEGRNHYDAGPTNERRSTEAIEALEFIATEFADMSSVDRTEFLKACGIEV